MEPFNDNKGQQSGAAAGLPPAHQTLQLQAHNSPTLALGPSDGDNSRDASVDCVSGSFEEEGT